MSACQRRNTWSQLGQKTWSLRKSHQTSSSQDATGQAKQWGCTQDWSMSGDGITQSSCPCGPGVPNHALSRTSKNAGPLVQNLLRISGWWEQSRKASRALLSTRSRTMAQISPCEAGARGPRRSAWQKCEHASWVFIPSTFSNPRFLRAAQVASRVWGWRKDQLDMILHCVF